MLGTEEKGIYDKKRRQTQIIVISLLVVIFGGVSYFVGKPLVAFVSDAEAFRIWVEDTGWTSRIVFLFMLVFQVVFAFIPGGIFEIAGGYAFGAWEGTLLSVIGTTLGSAAVFLLVKRYGLRFVLLFFSQEKLDSVKFMHNKNKLYLIIFIAFIIPGTPKDLLCYVAGLTDMKLGAWLLITSIARIPAITISTIGGNAIGTEQYIFAIIVFVITIILSIAGIFVYRHITKTENSDS